MKKLCINSRDDLLAMVEELPSIFQSIGTLNARLKMCKYGTKKYIKYDKSRNDLENKGSSFIYAIKMSLIENGIE